MAESRYFDDKEGGVYAVEATLPVAHVNEFERGLRNYKSILTKATLQSWTTHTTPVSSQTGFTRNLKTGVWAALNGVAGEFTYSTDNWKSATISGTTTGMSIFNAPTANTAAGVQVIGSDRSNADNANKIFSSTDGITFTSRACGTADNNGVRLLVFSENLSLFVAAVGRSGGGGAYTCTSTDGTTWTQRTLSTDWTQVAWTNWGSGVSDERVVFLPPAGDLLAYSDDGIAWKSSVAPATLTTSSSLTHNPDTKTWLYVDKTVCFASGDGLSWSPRTFPTTDTVVETGLLRPMGNLIVFELETNDDVRWLFYTEDAGRTWVTAQKFSATSGGLVGDLLGGQVMLRSRVDTDDFFASYSL